MKLKILIRMDEELKERLKEIAKEEHRSLTSQIVNILSGYCKNRGTIKNG
jgi:predicted transcriptional regulator